MSKSDNLHSHRNFNLVITHPGVFHADDVCAVAWMQITGVEAPVERRIPTPEELENPEVMVIDVGGQHDPVHHNYDHHQRGGAGERWDVGVPYAAFGLVYDMFQPRSFAVGKRLEERIVLPVDAADCGWGTREGTRPELSFSAVISSFNPGPSASPQERNVAFREAVGFARRVIENELRSAEEFVAAEEEVVGARTELDGRVLVLENFVPWAKHLYRRPDEAGILYVIFPSERGGFCLQQVPISAESFEGRKPLPEAWAGLRGEELKQLLELSSASGGDATFCHPGRFIGGAESFEDTLRMAELALS